MMMMLLAVGAAWNSTLAQEKTLVAPMGVDIHVRIEPTVTVEGIIALSRQK
jgi:hypothetical protein